MTDNQLWPCSLHSCIMLDILCMCVCVWLWHLQRWVAAFQPSLLGKLVTTTSGLERQHETLKYSYLSDMSNGSLADVLSIIVKTYVLHCQRR